VNPKQKNGFGNIAKRGAGTRSLVSQTESCEVERSPGCVGPDAQSERSDTEHRILLFEMMNYRYTTRRYLAFVIPASPTIILDAFVRLTLSNLD
jgi:hypothetical protein